MPTTPRDQIARAASRGLRSAIASLRKSPVVIGFDGFVDSIIDVVDQRHDLNRYDPITTIDRFSGKIHAAAGQSSNYELVTRLEKLGGNGPIMANAIAAAGLPTTYIGALGYPSLQAVFQDLAKQATCLSFCDPGFTDALEFSDGKIMLGKQGTLKGVSAERLKEVIGPAKLIEVMGRAVLLSMVNWTMLTRMNSIWDYLIADIFPKLPALSGGRRMVFIDLADPEKRTRSDLAEALGYGRKFQQQADVIFGFNLKEAVQVAEVLKVPVAGDPEKQIESMSVQLREKLDVRGVVIHPRAGAAAALQTGAKVESGFFAGPLVKKPRLSTGAGDNFNAGFCMGLMADLPVQQALCVGTATSGYYVRHAESPTLEALADFCDDLPAPE